MTETKTITATERTFEIIGRLVEKERTGVAELATELDLPKSTTHEHLHTLDSLGFVVNRDGTYRLSTRFLDIGERVRKRMKLYDISKSELHELAETTGEHASLVIEEHGRGVLLNTVKGKRAVQVDTHDGMQFRIHTTAPGKVILAHLPEERVREIVAEHGLRGMTENTITDEASLFEELSRIRKQGFAMDDEERIMGMRSIATPVTKPDGRVLGSVSVFGPSNRIDDDRFEAEIPQLLLRAANVIELNLNY